MIGHLPITVGVNHRDTGTQRGEGTWCNAFPGTRKGLGQFETDSAPLLSQVISQPGLSRTSVMTPAWEGCSESRKWQGRFSQH